MNPILSMLLFAAAAASDSKHYVDVSGWDDVPSATVPVYADGTYINPGGSLTIADPVQRAAYEKLPSLRQSCDMGSSSSCYELGQILQNEAFNWIKDPAASIPYLKKACTQNHADACLLLSASFQNGTGTDRDYRHALQISQKLCDRRVAEGCFNAAINYENGYGIRQDTAEALEYFGKSCDYGFQDGCDHFARINTTKR